MNQAHRGATAALAAVALALVFCVQAFAAPNFPRLSGRVVDEAHVLSDRAERELTVKLEALERQTGRQLVVATVPSLQGREIEDYGYQLGRAWGIGQRGTNTGAIFLIAPSEHKVRIEVGYGLEPILTDALSSVILQRTVIPKFRAGQTEAGIVAGTEAIIAQLSLPDSEARAVAARPPRPAATRIPPWLPILLFFLIFIVLRASIAGARGRGRSLGGGALPWIVLGALANSGRHHGGGWSGGGGGSWGGGGGGFSGGGGSFGGGGSSGSW